MIKLKQIVVQAKDDGSFIGALETYRINGTTTIVDKKYSVSRDLKALIDSTIKELEETIQSQVRYGIVKTIIKGNVSYDIEKVEILGPSHKEGLYIYVDKNGSRFTGSSSDFYRTKSEARRKIEADKLRNLQCSNQV